MTLLGIALVGAWVVVLLNDEQGMPRWVGSAGIAVTLAMMAVLMRSYITRRGLGGIVAALSILSLILSIVAMVVLLLLWT
mgnify:CR=1 FL=1